ncbi:MAG: YjdF family protein [Oscillospiraceae bacterium]|nr:YjdF family protein [Oscillospiraceae bacterium]
MADIAASFTVLFEDPFWVGVYERVDGRRYSVCKVTFGAQPKESDVYAFLLRSRDALRFSPTAAAADVGDRRINPKRLQRRIQKQLQPAGVGTKAQQAIRAQCEQGKLERTLHSREQREAEKQRQYELRAEKRKEKHRGR